MTIAFASDGVEIIPSKKGVNVALVDKSDEDVVNLMTGLIGPPTQVSNAELKRLRSFVEVPNFGA